MSVISDKLSARFGPNLRRLRERERWTQEELAERMSVSGPYVSMLEAGGRVPSLEVIEAVCFVFQVQVGELFK